MKISTGTLDILKNFATINTNILVRQGNTLSTISTGKNIFARAEISESFPKEFAIYDLNSLLALLSLMEDTDVDFQDESLIPSSDIDTVLTSSGYLEFFIYENDSTLAFQNYSYINYSDFLSL